MARSAARSDPVHRTHALKPRRLHVALLLGLLVALTTWLRSPNSTGDLVELRLLPQTHAEHKVDGFTLTGLWQLDSRDSRFGGYSALMLGNDGRFLAHSDRGARLSFGAPGLAPLAGAQTRQHPTRGQAQALWDIESATRDPFTGSYWLGYEATHALHRYSADHRADGWLRLAADWPDNGGAESMARLADGRFVILPEMRAEMLLFTGDPIEGFEAERLAVAWPVPVYAPTDMAQLPDGQLMVLMRRVVAALPPTFDSLLVIGDPPVAGEVWRPRLALRLAELLPRENYEGLAVRALADGDAELWLIADDNFSAFQRTLLARLIMDGGHEKAPGGEAHGR